jgi:sulfide dehydrogenase cytochrome subunit
MIAPGTLRAAVVLAAAASVPSGIVLAAPPPDTVMAAPPPDTVMAAPPPGASSCSGCHGATAPPPVLTGRDPAAIVAELDAFRAGTRPGTVMDRIAKGFSHDESVAIATWLVVRK